MMSIHPESNRTSTNNHYYSKIVISNNQAAYYSDQGHDQVSISESVLMPNQLEGILKDLQLQSVSQIRERLLH
jgi:hypothetical protein